MTPYEKELYITMVEMFIEHYPDNEIGQDGKPYMECSLCRAWQAMRADLIVLGLAQGHPLSSSLLATASEARQRLETNIPDSAPPFQEIFDDWMYLFSSYHRPTLPTTRRPFTVESVYIEIMELFVSFGFARKESVEYIWTDKIAPTMRSFYQWTPELEDLGDIQDADLSRQINASCNTLPLSFRRRLQRECDGLNFHRLILEGWDGDKWVPVPLHPWRVRTFHNLPFQLTKAIMSHVGWRPKPPSLWNRFNALFKIRT